MGHSNRETGIQRAVLDALRWWPDITIWRSNTGGVTIKGQFIRFGVTGQADLSGVIKPWGTRLEIELKRPGEHQRPEQRTFEAMIRDSGGVYILAHSADEAMSKLSQAIAELSERHARPLEIGG